MKKALIFIFTILMVVMSAPAVFATGEGKDVADYAITHQPTAEEPYVALNYGEDASYQWYEIKDLTEITDGNKLFSWSCFVSDFTAESTYNPVDGWSGLTYGEDDVLYYIVSDFDKGEKVTLKFSSPAAYVAFISLEASVECKVVGNTATAEIPSEGVYGICAIAENSNPSVKIYTGNERHTALANETDADLDAFGGFYYCKVTAANGQEFISDTVDLTYRISHQPTDTERYVALNNSAGAKYKWYSVKNSSIQITDANGFKLVLPEAPRIYGGKYESSTNNWSPDIDGYYFLVKLKRGDIIDLSFSSNPTILTYSFSVREGTIDSVTEINDSRIFAWNDGYYCINAKGGGDLYARIIRKEYVAVNGENTAVLGAEDLGKYVCEVTFANGQKAYSGEMSLNHKHTGGTATCMASAVCTVCSKSYGTTNANSHTGKNTVINKKDATCKFAGYTGDTKCECGKIVFKGTEIPASGAHIYDDACDTSCNVCGTTRVATHDYAAASCTQAKTCKNCGATSGAPFGHKYTNACDESCDACGATRVATHDYAAASCAQAKTCKNCGVTSGAPLGHEYTNACDESCNVCSAKRTIEHSYNNTVKKATLKKNGKVENKCSVCGLVKTVETVYYPETIKLSKTGYTYNGKVQKPSVTVKDSKGNKLIKDTDYTVKYENSNSKKPGEYSVTITFKGKYSGTKKLAYTVAPKVTENISATQTTTAITLKWSKVTGADGYRVYKYNSKKKKYEKLKDVTATSFKISKLKAGTKYKYKVRAYTDGEGKIWGGYSDVFETATKCNTPSIKKLTSTKGKANFTWTDVSGESGYQVYYSTKKSSGFKKVKSYSEDVVKGSKNKLESGKKYYFKVRAYTKTDDGTVYSSWSTVKNVKIK